MKNGTTKAIAAMALTVMSLLAASGAQATLFTRLNGQAVYDDVAQLTWLRDANYAKTSGYGNADVYGRMTWPVAMEWAAQLSIEGVTGWHLPGGPMEYGTDQTASEMANFFHKVLGGEAYFSIITHHNLNYDLFQNVQQLYWSSVECVGLNAPTGRPCNTGYAWYFQTEILDQFFLGKSNEIWGWAVHTGDVPAPGTLALLGAGLLGWIGVKRSRRAGESIGA